jgi:enoyl-[acyl-carrier protein] reductase II
MRVVRNETTRHYEEHPDELKPFPEQLLVASSGGFLHLPEGDEAQGVDPSRECYPAGQGVGAIDELVPAAELVTRFVAEAQEALARAAHARA